MINIEDELAAMPNKIFNILLKDRTTKKNICWATNGI